MASKPRPGDRQAVWLWGWDESKDAWKYMRVENNSLTVIDEPHTYIHDGFSYMAGNLWGEGGQVADDASAEMLVQAAVGCHLVMTISVTGNCELFIFEGPTFSNAGTSVTAYNKNRFSSNTTTNTITHTPTTSDDGTEIFSSILPGGVKSRGAGSQGSGYSGELILKSGEDYLFRVTNRSGSAQSVSISLEWYEPGA